MTKMIVLKTKINRTIENISKRKLSIQFSLDGFSFCASNHLGEVYYFSSYEFENESKSPEVLLKKITEVFNTEKSIQDDFESVFVIHQNTLNTFVPNSFFQEKSIKDYLKFSIKTLSSDLIVYDELEGMKNVYIPYVNINNFLFQNFGEFEYSHHATVLVKQLIEQSKSNTSYLYINVSTRELDILHIEDKNLTLYNSFEFETREDFIYYVLFVMEQQMLDPDVVPVTLMGAIEPSSELYQILYTYVRNVHFLKVTNSLAELSDHSHITLLR